MNIEKQKRWKPRKNQLYYFISNRGIEGPQRWGGGDLPIELERYHGFGVYQYASEANEIYKKFFKIVLKAIGPT